MLLEDVITHLKKAHEMYLEKVDIITLSEIYASDVLVHMTPFPDTKGLENYKQKGVSAHEGFTDRHISWEETIIQNNSVALRYTTHEKHTGVNPLFPVPPTGKEVITKGSVFFHVRKNKIIEEFWYIDMLGFLQQLGVIPKL
jgi:predicted ester cyclase